LELGHQRGDVLLNIDTVFPSLKELYVRGDLNSTPPKLERLHLSRRALLELPETVLACKKLKKLDVKDSVQLTGLPDSLTGLQQLDEIAITIHNRFENISVLAGLPKLKTIHVKYMGEVIPKPFYELLELPQWTALYIHGSFDDKGIAERILRRTNLTKLVIVNSFGENVMDIAEERKWLGIQLP
jgi:hypothetical protein